MQIESVELVKSVILKKQFLQMISLAAEEQVFLVLLCSFTENTLLLKDKNHSPFMEVSACIVEVTQKSCLSKVSGEGPEFSPMCVVLACGVTNEKCRNPCLLWILLHTSFSNNWQGDEFWSIWRCLSCLEKHRSHAGSCGSEAVFYLLQTCLLKNSLIQISFTPCLT